MFFYLCDKNASGERLNRAETLSEIIKSLSSSASPTKKNPGETARKKTDRSVNTNLSKVKKSCCHCGDLIIKDTSTGAGDGGGSRAKIQLGYVHTGERGWGEGNDRVREEKQMHKSDGNNKREEPVEERGRRRGRGGGGRHACWASCEVTAR